MKLNSKIHLYETAHSGFYSDDPTRTVNLVPKTWTKFTVTDGDWKTNKTLEPLWNRDIFLANEIDKVDEDKRNHYQASSHFVIDHKNKRFEVNPFDEIYEFGGGILYNSKNYYIYSDTPPRYISVTNELCNVDGLTYNCTALDPEEQEKEFPAPHGEGTPWKDPIFIYSATINGSEDLVTKYNETMQHAGIILVNNKQLYYNNDITSGGWKDSLVDCWSADVQERYVGPINGYNDRGTTAWENSAQYIVDDNGTVYDCFDPTDTTPTVTAGDFAAGSNLISGDVNMVPVNTLFIW